MPAFRFRLPWAAISVSILAASLAACAPAAPPSPPAASTPVAPAPAPAAPQVQPAAAAVPKTPATAAEIALYKGADRRQVLEVGARREGTVVLYTSMIVNTILQPLVNAFEKMHPGVVKVEYSRLDGDAILERVRQEYQAGRHEVDVVMDLTSPELLAAEGLAMPIYSPLMEAYPRDGAVGVHPEGLWAVINRNPRGIVFNTDLVPKGEVPTTWEGLRDPKWKGQVASVTSVTTGTPVFIGAWLHMMGEEKGMQFIQELGKQGIIVTVGVSATAIVDQVAAGQYSMCLCALHSAEIVKARGAPVDWVVPGDTVMERSNMIMVLKNSKHPHAAMLWADFMLDPEGGQKVLRETGYIVSHPKYAGVTPALQEKKVWGLTGDVLGREGSRWQELNKQHFVN